MLQVIDANGQPVTKPELTTKEKLGIMYGGAEWLPAEARPLALRVMARALKGDTRPLTNEFFTNKELKEINRIAQNSNDRTSNLYKYLPDFEQYQRIVNDKRYSNQVNNNQPRYDRFKFPNIGNGNALTIPQAQALLGELSKEGVQLIDYNNKNSDNNYAGNIKDDATTIKKLFTDTNYNVRNTIGRANISNGRLKDVYDFKPLPPEQRIEDPNYARRHDVFRLATEKYGAIPIDIQLGKYNNPLNDLAGKYGKKIQDKVYSLAESFLRATGNSF